MDNQIQLFWWPYFRNAQPRFQFVVMNRRNTENLVEDLLGDFEFEIQVPYLLYRNAAQEVNGIWFYNSRECQEVGNLFSRILSAYSKVSPKPKLSSNKSEYEELEAVPTCAVIEGPLEPSFTVPAHTDVAEDSSFLNFFDAATSIGANPSKPLNTGQPYYASAPNIAPTSRVPGPIPSPTSNLQVPTAPQSAPSIPSLSLHEGTDPTTIKTNQVANLVKPSTFFTPPLSPVLPINPVASSISTPALHPPLNIQRPHGTPMLQPFPPPTPPPSLTSNPSPINVSLSREKVRDALLVLVQDNQFIDLVYQALLKVQQSDLKGKFEAKSDEGIFLRYSINSKAYRVFNKRTNTIQESANVTVDDKISTPQKKDDDELLHTSPTAEIPAETAQERVECSKEPSTRLHTTPTIANATSPKQPCRHAAASWLPLTGRRPHSATAHGSRRASPRSSSSSPVKPSSRRSDSDDPVEHFDESVGDSIVVHNTSHRVFRAFSFVFYCSSLNFLLETFSARNFIHQRRLDVDSFSSRTDLVETLKTAKLFKTVTKVERFVRDVVFEFYTNLVPKLTNARLAYVRGRFYEFSPRVINAYYGLPGYADYFDKDFHEITKRLTGGHAPYWISKDSIKASDLTSFFAFLNKIAFSNWMPSTNHRYVTKKMVALLFKIDTGVSFDLGQLLFDQIVDARNGKVGKKDLVLPNLIYGLHVMQGFQKHSSEYFEAHPVPIKFDQRLLSGSHFDDLGLSRDVVTARPSSSANCGALAIEFLEKELCLISAQRKDLVNRELQVQSLLLKLKGFGTLGSVDRSLNDKAVASESASSSPDRSPRS
nr:mRNA-decapping enzyme-like protein [Ipomoea batatas]